MTPEPEALSAAVAGLGLPISNERIRAALAQPIAQVDDAEETRNWIRGLRAGVRRESYEESVPTIFRGATYDQLDGDQQGRDAVAGWLASTSPTLLLTGPVGVGKTFAAYAVLRDALEQGMHVRGATVHDLLEALKPSAPASPLPRLAAEADVWLFDDLGMDRATDWNMDQIGAIVDERTRWRKRQVVTTNLGRADLEQRLGTRTVSRLAAGSTIVKFSGVDRREETW